MWIKSKYLGKGKVSFLKNPREKILSDFKNKLFPIKNI